MLPSKKRIGIIGGGQLGKMLAEAGSPWTVRYNFLDVNGSPCQSKAEVFVEGKLNDAIAIKKLAEVSDVLSYEIEHINTEVLIELEKQGKDIIPKPSVLEIIKDKGSQNNFLRDNNIAIPTYVNLQKEEDWTICLSKFEGENIVVKSRTGGYDGKGVVILSKEKILAGERPFPTTNTLFEQFIEEVVEVSVIVSVDRKGNYKTFPPVVMEFDPSSNLVLFLHTETGLSDEILKQCNDISSQAVLGFNSPGLFAVELFITQDKQVLVNEIAPRPHNSGHHTIESAYTSQFEQLNRILLGLPLGETDNICPAAMINLVGPEALVGEYTLEGVDKTLLTAGIYIHLYGKSESRPNRKLGHITVLGKDKSELFERVKWVRENIKVKQASPTPQK